MDIKSKLKKNLLLLFALNEYHRIKYNFIAKKYSDEKFIYKKFKKTTGRDLNLSNPVRYTDKLQWLKLFYRDEEIEITTDKYTVREYLEKKGYGYILNDLIGAYDNPDDIDFDSLPDKFVLKLSHGSGWNIVCKDKSKINWPMYKHIIKSWLKQNLYVYGREWNYKNLEPKIIIEKYLDNGDGQLIDYKFHCFNGEPLYVLVARDRFSDCKFSTYDMNWDRFTNIKNAHLPPEKRPPCFEEMRNIATELCKKFPCVRIDFYNIENKIYFGEFTYFESSGFFNFIDEKQDFLRGEKLQLPKPNHNLDLFEKITSENS